MTKTEVAKATVHFIVGAGVTKIVSGIVKHNTDPEKITDKVTITSGSIVLGMMAADATQSFTDAKIDALIAWYYENIKKTN